MAKQQHDYSIVKKIERLLIPIRRIDYFEGKFKIFYKEHKFIIYINRIRKYNENSITLEHYTSIDHIFQYDDELSISCEGDGTQKWNEIKTIFLSILRDNFGDIQ